MSNNLEALEDEIVSFKLVGQHPSIINIGEFGYADYDWRNFTKAVLDITNFTSEDQYKVSPFYHKDELKLEDIQPASDKLKRIYETIIKEVEK